MNERENKKKRHRNRMLWIGTSSKVVGANSSVDFRSLTAASAFQLTLGFGTRYCLGFANVRAYFWKYKVSLVIMRVCTGVMNEKTQGRVGNGAKLVLFLIHICWLIEISLSSPRFFDFFD